MRSAVTLQPSKATVSTWQSEKAAFCKIETACSFTFVGQAKDLGLILVANR